MKNNDSIVVYIYITIYITKRRKIHIAINIEILKYEKNIFSSYICSHQLYELNEFLNYIELMSFLLLLLIYKKKMK